VDFVVGIARLLHQILHEGEGFAVVHRIEERDIDQGRGFIWRDVEQPRVG
jgi:hypothetical protein